MTAIRTIAVIALLILIAAIINAVAAGDMMAEGRRLTAMPWGVLTLVDLTVGFVLVAMWIAVREASTGAAVAWIVALFILGNVVSLAYLLRALSQAGGDRGALLLGPGQGRSAGG